MHAELPTTTLVPVQQVVEPEPYRLPEQHTIYLTWADARKVTTVVLCGCGWVGQPRRPEVDGSVQAAIAEHEGHLVDVGYLQLELPA